MFFASYRRGNTEQAPAARIRRAAAQHGWRARPGTICRRAGRNGGKTTRIIRFESGSVGDRRRRHPRETGAPRGKTCAAPATVTRCLNPHRRERARNRVDPAAIDRGVADNGRRPQRDSTAARRTSAGLRPTRDPDAPSVNQTTAQSASPLLQMVRQLRVAASRPAGPLVLAAVLLAHGLVLAWLLDHAPDRSSRPEAPPIVVSLLAPAPAAITPVGRAANDATHAEPKAPRTPPAPPKRSKPAVQAKPAGRAYRSASQRSRSQQGKPTARRRLRHRLRPRCPRCPRRPHRRRPCQCRNSQHRRQAPRPRRKS